MNKRKFALKNILIVFCIFILYIPLLALVFSVKINYSQLANRKISEILESKIQQNDTAISNVMSKMVVVSGSIAINPEVVHYLESGSDISGTLCSAALEQTEMLLANSFELPMNIIIFGEDKILKTWVGGVQTKDFYSKMEGELGRYAKQKKAITWFCNEESIFDFYAEGETKCLNLLRRINLSGNQKNYWVIASIDLQVLSKLLFGNSQEVAEVYTLQDEIRNMEIDLYSAAAEISGQERKKYINQQYNNMSYQVHSDFSSYGTKLNSSMIMDSQNLMVDLNHLNIIFYFGLVIILFIFLAALFVLIRYLTRPIGSLMRTMERTKATQEYLPVCNVTSIAEISSLNHWYNIMVESINDYISQIKYQEQEKRRLHFQMLQMQINPHFLFNTLNSIKWVCYMNKDNKAGNLIAALGRMYEISMNKGSLHLTLREEKEFIESYVRLMENRYDIKVDFIFYIPEELENAKLLKFIIQPVVENIFLHGFQDLEGKKEIDINAEIIEGKMGIVVKDNGAGISDTKMVELQKELSQKEREVTKVGIVNVNHRIRIHYGEEYGLWVSERGDWQQGLEVRLLLPVKQEGGEDDSSVDC